MTVHGSNNIKVNKGYKFFLVILRICCAMFSENVQLSVTSAGVKQNTYCMA